MNGKTVAGVAGIIIAVVVGIIVIGAVSSSMEAADRENRLAEIDRMAVEAGIGEEAAKLADDARQYLLSDEAGHIPDGAKQIFAEELDKCETLPGVVERAACIEVTAENILR